MAASTDKTRAKYPVTFTDADEALFALYYLHSLGRGNATG